MTLNKLTLDDLNRVIGLWWLPGNDKNQIHGVLELNNDHLQLRTTQMFEGVESLEKETIPIIHGLTATGLKLTLLNCKKHSQTIHAPGMAEMIFEFAKIIAGENYASDNILVKSLICRFDGLEEWLNDMPLDAFRYDDTWQAQCKMPEKYSCTVENFTATVESEIKLHLNRNVGAGFERFASINFVFANPTDLFEAVLQARKYSDFLTLCIGRYSNILSVQAVDINEVNIAILDNLKEIGTTSSQCLIPFTYVKENYQNCLQTWYHKYEEIKPVIGYFVEACQKKSHIHLPMEFLKMVQALESYSRRMRKATIISPEEHQERINRIVSHFEDGDEDKEWIIDVLKTPVLNEPSCSQRITNLIKETAVDLGIEKKKVKSIAYKIVTTRNYYTHFNEKLLHDIFSDHDAFYSIALMKNVLKVVLCRELSIELPNMKDILSRDAELTTALGELGLSTPTKMCTVEIIDKADTGKMENSNSGIESKADN